MKRTKLKDRILPTYTKGEEIFNMVSHIVGGGIGVIALIVCIILSIVHKNIYGVISSIIFGTTIILLYTMSSIYHGLNAELKAKKVLQVIDHCSIFLLIAGSYTPFALCTLREHNATLGWTIFGIVWGLAVLGIVLNAIDLKKYKVFSMICYLLMGWCIIIKASVLPQLLTPVGFALLLVGGIVYTIGAILYGAGKKHKWMHSIFHLACVLGSLLHFLCVAIYVV
ncbi:MAG: hemolysin III family protein [Clostridia bacterium]|nr:hemolysin III family protein [Clostridia bacterium]